MKEPFDKIVKEKLENFIETNQVDYQPEHWQQLMQKKKTKKKVVFYWRWVAVLLLFLLAGGMVKMFYNQDEIIPTSSKKEVAKVVDTVSNKNTKNSDNKTIAYEDTDENVKNKEDFKKKTTPKSIAKFPKNNNIKKQDNSVLLSEKAIAQVPDNVGNNNVESNKEFGKEALENKLNNDNKEEKEVAISNEKTIKKDISKLKIEEEEVKKAHTEKSYRKITLGFDASSMLSYNSDGERNQLGYSGGMSLEVPLFKHLDIQAGVIYSNQKMAYAVHPQRQLLAARGGHKTLTPGAELSSREVTVNMIEIPLSLKYNFKVKQQKLFVSAGISASSVLNEKISSQYDVGEKAVVSTPLASSNAMEANNDAKVTYEYRTYQPVVTTEKQLNHFYPVSAFQLSLGGEFAVGKTQSVVIEPYYKKFIHSITTKKATLSNVGVKLQYRFDFKLKK